MESSSAGTHFLVHTDPDLLPINSEQSALTSISHQIIEDLEDLACLREEWRDLSDAASEPNVFFDQWFLEAALRNLGEPDVRIFLAWASDDQGHRILIALFPIIQKQSYRGLPVAYVSIWQHRQCFLNTPLVRRGYEKEAISEFFEYLDGVSDCRFFLMENVAADGPFFQNLSLCLRDANRPFGNLDVINRAVLSSALNADEYLKNALAGRRRKEIRRKESRLREEGTLELRVLKPDGDVREWTSQFLKLENSGWKGEQNSALAQSEAETEFFHKLTRNAFEAGQLMMLMLALNGQPLAMKINFLSGRGSFAFKIAYAEEYARFSPGLLLELANVEYVLSAKPVDWMDSCAAPDHFMINRLWTERRSLCTLPIGTGSIANKLFLRAMTIGQSGYRFLKKIRGKANEASDTE